MADIKLKKCPFCGSEAKLVHIADHYVVCCINSECGVEPHSTLSMSKEDAIKYWNTRHGETIHINHVENLVL